MRRRVLPRRWSIKLRRSQESRQYRSPMYDERSVRTALEQLYLIFLNEVQNKLGIGTLDEFVTLNFFHKCIELTSGFEFGNQNCIGISGDIVERAHIRMFGDALLDLEQFSVRNTQLDNRLNIISQKFIIESRRVALNHIGLFHCPH